MPWTTADVDEHNKGLTDAQKETWVEVANDRLKACMDDDGEQDKCEASAIKQANSAVSEKKTDEERGLLRSLWESIKQLFEPHLERATSFSSLYEQAAGALYSSNEMAWLHDLYRDDDGSMFVIASERGKLYRVPITASDEGVTLGEWLPVMEGFKPVAQATRTSVIRQADGRYRWLSISCTSVLNRVGEIDSQALFDSFVAHADETGEYPYRTFYHQGEALATGRADFLARDGDTFITSGLYDEGNPLAEAEIAALEREAALWGESINYMPTVSPVMFEVAEGINVPVYEAGKLREISFLPVDKAAAWFTTVRAQEVTRMRADVLQALVELLDGDEERADEFAALVDGTNRAITEAGLVSREAEAEGGPEPAPEPTEAPAQEAPAIEREVELDEAALALIAEQFAELLAPLTEKLEELESAMGDALRAAELSRETVGERLKALEIDEGEKKRQWLADVPRRETLKVTHRPREANATDDDGEPITPNPSAVLDAAGIPQYA